jgi:EF hand
MMRRYFTTIGAILFGATLAGVATQSALAQATAPAAVSRDTDNDQTLDLAEVKAAASAHFDKLDLDGDKSLDAKEVKGLIGPKTFKAADPDNDGNLSKDEYLALVEKLFKTADADHDGTLSVKELHSPSGRALKRLLD